MKARTTILVADDHAIIAEALAASLSRWFSVVGTISVLDQLDGEIRSKSPDVVVLDLGFGKVSALPMLGPLVLRYPSTRFVILTAFAEPTLADAALQAGAMAYVVKQSAASELRVAIDEALAGRTYLTPILRARGAGGEAPTPRPVNIELSEQQRTLLGLLRQGLTNRAIADQLEIGTKTVDYHIAVLGRKIGVTGKAQLIRWSERFFENEV